MFERNPKQRMEFPIDLPSMALATTTDETTRIHLWLLVVAWRGESAVPIEESGSVAGSVYDVSVRVLYTTEDPYLYCSLSLLLSNKKKMDLTNKPSQQD